MKSINLLFILLFASKTFSQIASLSNTIDPKEFDKVMDTQVIPSNISGNYVIYASRPGSYSQDLTLVNPETGTIGKKISLPEYDSYKLFYNEGFSRFWPSWGNLAANSESTPSLEYYVLGSLSRLPFLVII